MVSEKAMRGVSGSRGRFLPIVNEERLVSILKDLLIVPNSKRKMKNWLTHNLALKLTALGLAVFTWIYVNGN